MYLPAVNRYIGQKTDEIKKRILENKKRLRLPHHRAVDSKLIS